MGSSWEKTNAQDGLPWEICFRLLQNWSVVSEVIEPVVLVLVLVLGWCKWVEPACFLTISDKRTPGSIGRVV